MINVNSKDLLAGLKKLASAINNPSIPILANVRIIGNDSSNFLELFGSNLNQSIKTVIPCESKSRIDTTINYKKLVSICSNLPDGCLNIEMKGDIANLKCGKSKFKISCIPSENWPGDSLMAGPVEIFFDRSVFIKEVNNVFYAASKDESRPVLNGVLIDAERDSLKLVATDGKRLAMTEVINATQKQIQAIIPVSFLLDVCKNSDNEIKLLIDDSLIFAESGNYSISSKLIEGKYPNYNQIIPDKFESQVTINKYDLLNAVQRVSLILDNVQESVKLSFKDNELSVTAKTMDSASEKLSIDFIGEFELFYNPLFLIDAFKNSSGDTIDLNYNDKTSPTLITCENLEYLVMPMRGN